MAPWHPSLPAFMGFWCVQITGLPEVIEHNGRGPLLNAKELDRAICWRRAQQLCELSATVSTCTCAASWDH